MIEIICRENLQNEEQKPQKERRCLPKNIRQVGSPRGRHKIYIEDYVYTYIRNMARKKDSCAAIFLGTTQVDKDIRCTFVSGAVECGGAVFQWDNIRLDDSFWDYIYKEKKQYFPDLEIVGWFLGKGGQPMELSASVESAHRKYFAGRDKLLMLMDVLEGEEVFFVHEQGYLQKREGYYIYYEKNLPMQEYMVSKHEEELQLDRLAGREGAGHGLGNGGRGSEGAGFAGLWKEMESEEPEAMPRTGEFEDLYQELQQLDSKPKSPKLSQETPDSITPTPPQEKPGSQAEDPPRAEPENWSSQPQKLFQEILGIQNRNPGKGRAASARQEQEKETLDTRRETLVQDQAKVLREKSVSQKKRSGGTGENAAEIFAKKNEKEPQTPAEEALGSYRNMALERHGRQIAKQNRNFLYTASSFFLVILCVMGITTINNYRKMQEVEETLHILKATEEKRGDSENGAEGQGDSQGGAESQDGLVVESIGSQVTPLEEQGQQKQADSKDTAASDSTQPNKTDDTAETSAQDQGRVRYYTVQPGDTLDSICMSIYNSLDIREELCQLNKIEDGNKIFVGQKLQLP